MNHDFGPHSSGLIPSDEKPVKPSIPLHHDDHAGRCACDVISSQHDTTVIPGPAWDPGWTHPGECFERLPAQIAEKLPRQWQRLTAGSETVYPTWGPK